jgi:DNA end-binding protein Ku
MARTKSQSSKPTSHRRRSEPSDDKGETRADAPRRALWSGTLGFGLLQIPINVYPLERAHELSFHQLDGRDLSPVGYKRYNKSTGAEVPYDEIVRGYEIAKGEYIVVSDEELKAANVEATQSIDIEDFVDPASIPAAYYETPYLLAPAKRGEKAYAVLHAALAAKQRAAIATVVLRQRQHLAAVLVDGDSLVLEILRFAHELRPADAKTVTGSGAATPKITEREREMAEALVDDMTAEWDPTKYRDRYRDDVLAMIEKKAKTGEAVTAEVGKAPQPIADVTDLTALLRRSLKRSVPTKKAS